MSSTIEVISLIASSALAGTWLITPERSILAKILSSAVAPSAASVAAWTRSRIAHASGARPPCWLMHEASSSAMRDAR